MFFGADIMEALDSEIKEIEYVAAQVGFVFKEWIVSFQQVPLQVISSALLDI